VAKVGLNQRGFLEKVALRKGETPFSILIGKIQKRKGGNGVGSFMGQSLLEEVFVVGDSVGQA
jgi:hypothetical protein